MYKIGICGHFNHNLEPIGGQTIKTRIISDELKKIYKVSNIYELDTEGWRKNKIKFILKAINLVIKSDNIVILPAHNGVKLLLPFFLIISKIFGKKLHYIVVGAWLADLLEKHKYLQMFCKKIDYIYPQTLTLSEKLERFNISENVYQLPNFKDMKTVSKDSIKREDNTIKKVCMVSRVNQKKGINTAIQTISELNNKAGYIMIELDIFGPIDEAYNKSFQKQLLEHSDYVNYKGILKFNETTKIIKDYYLMLFPTEYYTEGIPGTILDSYFSGVPVIASRWESWKDVILEGKTGYTYEFSNNEDFKEKLLFLINNPIIVYEMRFNCLNESKKYIPEHAINNLKMNINS